MSDPGLHIETALVMQQLHGAKEIMVERIRQVVNEGWDFEHDDGYTQGQLLWAAVSYLQRAQEQTQGIAIQEGDPPTTWPFHKGWWKPSDDPLRNMTKAGALLAAEMDRLERLRSDGAR